MPHNSQQHKLDLAWPWACGRCFEARVASATDRCTYLLLAQLETLVMLAHMSHRTFVMPDHLSRSLYLLKGAPSVSDFYCFGDVGRWIPVISMQQYLDDRQASLSEASTL